MKVDVRVKDKSTLELMSDASKGDIIDLNDLTDIDMSLIIKAIDEGKDKKYNEKLEEAKKQLQEKHDLLLKNVEVEYENRIQSEVRDAQAKAKDEINTLKNEIEILKQTKEKDITLKVNEEINKLNKEHSKDIKTLNNQILELINSKHEIESELAILNTRKSMLNSKALGNNLEDYCNDLALSYMQNGLFNCTWYKDNIVVTTDDESKGSKADFIFKVFVDEKHLNDPLATVCLEMKDDNPETKTRKKDSDFFKQLDKNRKKKNCEYAVLVSRLELENESKSPMYRVFDYENMYVVRPEYMMIFLNIITSLTLKAKNLILDARKQKIDILKKQQMIDVFNQLKAKYLEGPMDKLQKDIQDIRKGCDSIVKAKDAIEKACDNIENKFISKMEVNLDKFQMEIEKEYKKAGINDEDH